MVSRLEFRVLLHDLWAQRLRTALTLLGITWGTTAIVLLLAFGEGVHEQNAKQMKGIGEGVVIVWGGVTSKPYQGFNRGRSILLVEEDVELLRREIPEILHISPEYSRYRVAVKGPRNVDQTTVAGVIPEYGDIRNVFASPGGRFIDRLDMKYTRRVAFIGDRLRDFLFGPGEEVIGKTVLIERMPFTVIGVLKKKQQSSSYNMQDADRVFIPATTFKVVFGHRYISNFVYKLKRPEDNGVAEKKMYRLLGRKYRFNPDDLDALYVWDTSKMQAVFDHFLLGFQIFLGLMGFLTLVVGGIGVANIMYVVVRERAPEIGIRRAVGAHRRNILLQFLVEAAFIVAAGAAIGFALAMMLVEILQFLPADVVDVVGVPKVSPVISAVCIAVLGMVALLAGYFPARRAALIDPVQAIREA